MGKFRWSGERLRVIAVATITLLVGPAAASAGIVFDGSPGAQAPPSTLGPYVMDPFPEDPRPDGVRVGGTRGPTGTLTFDQTLTHAEIGDSWLTWSHGYDGDVYFTSSSKNPDRVVLRLPDNTGAFYFYAEPNIFERFTVTATAQNGSTSGPVVVHGFHGARYFGFFGTGRSVIVRIEVTADSDAKGFAVGEFAVASAMSPRCTIRGTDGPDALTGTDGFDVICGLGGNDVIDGAAGNDILSGGPGDDVLRGEIGHDRLIADDGNDQLDGGNGSDRLIAGSGDDHLLGGPLNDRLFGQAGRDRLAGGDGNDNINGGPHVDHCAQDAGRGVIEACESHVLWGYEAARDNAEIRQYHFGPSAAPPVTSGSRCVPRHAAGFTTSLNGRGIAFDPSDGNLWSTQVDRDFDGDGYIHKNTPPPACQPVRSLPFADGPGGAVQDDIGALDLDPVTGHLWAAGYQPVPGAHGVRDESILYRVHRTTGRIVASCAVPFQGGGVGNDTLAVVRTTRLPGSGTYLLTDAGEARTRPNRFILIDAADCQYGQLVPALRTFAKNGVATGIDYEWFGLLRSTLSSLWIDGDAPFARPRLVGSLHSREIEDIATCSIHATTEPSVSAEHCPVP